jgi:hypothetical protein
MDEIENLVQVIIPKRALILAGASNKISASHPRQKKHIG